MREHHAHHRHNKLIWRCLTKLLDADLYVPKRNFSDFIFVISKTFDHDRHQLWKVFDKVVVAAGQEEQDTAVGLSNLAVLVLRFNDDFFNIDLEVLDSMGRDEFSESLSCTKLLASRLVMRIKMLSQPIEHFK